MGLFDNCVLACDIDGTLVAGDYINPLNVEKIDFFMKEGGMFSLSTGRTMGAVAPVLRKLNRVSPSIVANGCMIYDFENNKVLFETHIPESDYSVVNAVLKTGINVGIEVHAGTEILTVKRTSETDDHQAYEELVAKSVTFEEASSYKWNKVVYMFDSLEDKQAVKELISSLKTDSTFMDTCAEISGRRRNYYEQVPNGASKAIALKKLCELLKIKSGGAFAMGDYYNDLEMVKTADIGAVPIDSPEDIKQNAKYITCSCKNGAVADFIDYLTMVLQGENAL